MCTGFGSAHCLSQWWAARKEDLTPNTACSVWGLPRCLSYCTSWITWDWVDIFIWSTYDTLKPRSWCVYWPSGKFPDLSSAYINRFSAPFTFKHSGCHEIGAVSCTPLIFDVLEELKFATTRLNSGASLGYTWKEIFHTQNVKLTEQVDLWNLWMSYKKKWRYHDILLWVKIPLLRERSRLKFIFISNLLWVKLLLKFDQARKSKTHWVFFKTHICHHLKLLFFLGRKETGPICPEMNNHSPFHYS